MVYIPRENAITIEAVVAGAIARPPPSRRARSEADGCLLRYDRYPVGNGECREREGYVVGTASKRLNRFGARKRRADDADGKVDGQNRRCVLCFVAPGCGKRGLWIAGALDWYGAYRRPFIFRFSQLPALAVILNWCNDK